MSKMLLTNGMKQTKRMKKILLLVGLVLAAVLPAQAADYVLTYVNGGTTYYLARNGTSGVQRTSTFDPTTCIWHCASNTAGTTAGTLTNSNTYGYLYQTVNGTRYFLHANGNALGLGTNAGANNYYRWRTNGTYVYNRYNNYTSYYINLVNGVARNTTANTASNARPYQVTTNNEAEAITGSLSTPTITPSEAQTVEYNGSASYTASATGPTRIVPAHTTYAFNSTTLYYYDNQAYNSVNGFATNNPEVTYTWTLSGDGANALQLMSTTGENTIVKYTGSASGTTATLTVTARVGTLSRTASVTINITPVEPTAITATGTTVYMGNSGTVVYTLTPGYAYRRVSATSGNTGVFTVSSPSTSGAVAITPVAPGKAPITLTALNSNGSAGPSVVDTVIVRDVCAAPQFSFAQSGSTVLATITTTTPGATIRYTTDGTDPTPTTGTVYSSAPFTVADGTTIKAIVVKDEYYDPSAVAAKVVHPIDYVEQGVSGGIVTLNDLEDHTWSYYSDSLCPIRSLNPADVKITYYGNGTGTVQTNNNDAPSTWGADATTVKVGIDADASTFEYYETLERINGRGAASKAAANGRCAYTTIANPFSVRPTYDSDGTSKYRGFYGWRVKKVKNGTIHSAATGGTTYAANSIINAETEIFFNPTNEYGMEVEFEALWARAYVSTSGVPSNSLGVERNFYVITTSATSNITAGGNPCTYTSIYPNGTTNGTTAATSVTVYKYGGFSATADSKIEYIILRNNNSTINATGHNFTIGRGVTGYNNGNCANNIYGLSANSTTSFRMRIESGTYSNLYFMGANGLTSGVLTSVVGSDYDRANNNDNTKLRVTNDILVSNQGYIGSNTNVGADAFICTVKSGNFFLTSDVPGGGYQFYLSSPQASRTYGKRTLIIEGGRFSDIAGGLDMDASTTMAAVNSEMVEIRIKGGQMDGAVYGAAQFSNAAGNRRMVFTGGNFTGWIAGGANGTQTDGGRMAGASYIYVGGKANVNSNGSSTLMNRAVGGNVFGAGCGNSASSSSGQVTVETNVVLADDAYVERGVYGGGSYGYTTATANLYILGGTVGGQPGGVNGTTYNADIAGGVYGGACQNRGGTVNIYMNGGEVHSGIHGGSNANGTISGNVTMHIDGGQVGTTTQNANIHGGGYGSATMVNGNVDLTLGKDCNATSGVTVYGDVYGGSAEGIVNSSSSNHTNVSLYKGIIYGALYGGGLGTSTNAADVNGTVAVKVYGGSVRTNDGTGENGSGGVFGCNNTKGAPQGNVTVDIYGTDTAEAGHEFALYAVYGGGNRSDYDGTPVVTIHGCDNLIEYVYGGGNASAVRGTNVTIWGGHIGNAFGGGNGFSVTGNHDDENGEHYNPGANITTSGTNLTIHGGTIDAAFGGSNQWGTINDDITVTVTAAKENTNDPCTGVAYMQCPIDITELYGGGNEAPVLKEDGTYIASNKIKVNITSCDAKIANFFGGAKKANYVGDISLEITQGEFGSVFGGNNLGGTITGNITLTLKGGTMVNAFGGNNLGGSITGTITVLVDSTGTECPLKVDNVYGGGNQAAYEPTDPTAATPTVTFVNGTVRNAVFGGGLGEKAKISANPTVTIGGTGSKHAVVGGTRINGTKGDGNVYGGGSQADVLKTGDNTGNTSVTLTGNAVVKGNVYGGGNEANVEGDTKVELK